MPRTLRSALARVNLARLLQLGFRDGHGGSGGADRAEEAGLVTFMAGRARLFHLDEQRVAVAIDEGFDETLGMAGGFALAPERFARTRQYR